MDEEGAMVWCVILCSSFLTNRERCSGMSVKRMERKGERVRGSTAVAVPISGSGAKGGDFFPLSKVKRGWAYGVNFGLS